MKINPSQVKSGLDNGDTNPKIAKDLGVSVCTVQRCASKYFGGKRNYHRKKHNHEEFYEYFKTHSYEETKNHFNLTDKQCKSLFTYFYSSNTGTRKDKKRVFTKWGAEEYRFLFLHIGLQPRNEIARRMLRTKKESSTVIKERCAKLGIATKNIPGLTIAQYQSIFKCSPKLTLKTLSGPLHTKWRIIPWVVVEKECNNLPVVFQQYVAIMAMFQRWIHGDNVLESLRKSLAWEHIPLIPRPRLSDNAL